MSVILYSGTPGSYKSFHAVKTAINALRSGKNLITNFPLDYMHKLKKQPSGVYQFVNNLDLTVDFLIDFAVAHHHKGVKVQTLVIIDEASIKFNSREFSARDRLNWINFFANHRHFNYDIILISQQDIMIDKQIRGLIETEFKHRSLKDYKAFGFFLNLFFHGCYMIVEYWYPCKLRVGSDFCLFNKKVAECYDTMGLFVGNKNQMGLARTKLDMVQNTSTIISGERFVSLGDYSAFRSEIIDFKFHNNKKLADSFGKKIAESVKSFFDVDFDYVTFVPSLNSSRSYNPSELLARSVAGVLGIPCRSLLSKVRKNREQKELSRDERSENVDGVFSCTEIFGNKNVLLVDDVITTGSTLTSCCQALKKYNDCSVYCAVIANES